jgi:hypothetical protein
MRAEYPLIPYLEMYVQPIIDGDYQVSSVMAGDAEDAS